MKHEDSLKDLNLQIDIPCLNCDQLIDYKDVGEIIIAVKLISVFTAYFRSALTHMHQSKISCHAIRKAENIKHCNAG